MKSKILLLLFTFLIIGSGCSKKGDSVNIQTSLKTQPLSYIAPRVSDTWEDFTYTPPKGWKEVLHISATSSLASATEARLVSLTPKLDIQTYEIPMCEMQIYVSGGEISISVGQNSHETHTKTTTTSTIDTLIATRHSFQDNCTKNEQATDYHFSRNETSYYISLRTAGDDFKPLSKTFDNLVSSIHFSNATTTRFGQISRFITSDDQKITTLSINPQQWLTGQIGEQTAREDGQCPYTEQDGPCLPNGFYIRESLGIRTLVINHDIEVLLYDRVQGAPTGTFTRMNLDQFKRLWKQSESITEGDNIIKSHYFFEFQGNKLRSIIEQYIP